MQESCFRTSYRWLLAVGENSSDWAEITTNQVFRCKESEYAVGNRFIRRFLKLVKNRSELGLGVFSGDFFRPEPIEQSRSARIRKAAESRAPASFIHSSVKAQSKLKLWIALPSAG